jgi:4,5-dihydroxyphthalate decarboxylase
MHLIAIRRDVYEKNRWIAQSLYQAFRDAKDQALAHLSKWEQVMNANQAIPWLTAHLAENRSVLGDDPWPYGLDANRKTLDAFLRYHHEQGLSPRQLAAEELFAPETLVDHARF